MTGLSDDEQKMIELEVRRLISTEEMQLRNMYGEEAKRYREFLQRQFSQIVLGVSVLAVVGAGLFVWFFSDSVDRIRSSLETSIDRSVIDYRIVDTFRDQASELIRIEIESDSTTDLIVAEIQAQSRSVANDLVGDSIDRVIQSRIEDLTDLDTMELIRSATLPSGAIIPFSGDCPPGWETFQEGQGRVIFGAGQGPMPFRLEPGHTGGQAAVSLTTAHLPQHAHSMDLYMGDDSTGGRWPQGGDAQPGRISSDHTSTGSVGSNDTFNIIPPYVALNRCIRG